MGYKLYPGGPSIFNLLAKGLPATLHNGLCSMANVEEKVQQMEAQADDNCYIVGSQVTKKLE
jgi:hypothetical protein